MLYLQGTTQRELAQLEGQKSKSQGRHIDISYMQKIHYSTAKRQPCKLQRLGGACVNLIQQRQLQKSDGQKSIKRSQWMNATLKQQEGSHKLVTQIMYLFIRFQSTYYSTCTSRGTCQLQTSHENVYPRLCCVLRADGSINQIHGETDQPRVNLRTPAIIRGHGRATQLFSLGNNEITNGSSVGCQPCTV